MAGPDNGPPGYPEQQDGHGHKTNEAADDITDGGPRVDGKAAPPTQEQLDELNGVTKQTQRTPLR